MPRFSVIIVNYNAGPRLAKCLRHLAAQTVAPVETIVYDNASDDGSIGALADDFPEVTVVHGDSNIGFAAANNRAAAEAKGDWLVFLNPDAYAQPDWLEAIAAGIEDYPDSAAFGSLQLDDADPSRVDGAGDVYHAVGLAYRGHFQQLRDTAPGVGECFAPCAAAAAYRRDTFESLGGFDERFFCYCEDVDLGFRLRLAGGRAAQLPSAVVRHEGSAVTGRHSDFTVYHGTRNRIWMAYKNTPGLLYWPILPLQVLFNLVMFVRAIATGCGPAFARGMRDGYGGLVELNSERRAQQRDRKVAIADIARTMAWSPGKLLSRGANIWPINTPSD